ncbi:MAG: hypothetical protein JSV68_18215 [Anaerolineaceae bacterium]|nr:MAG: hypothetical protein JSV68_18215 [Anaerolineaceae bacterium]
MLKAYRERGKEAITGDEYVLEQARLSWARGYLFRTILIDILGLTACLATWRKNLNFFKLTLQSIWQLPAEVGWFERLNIARNVFKKVGVREIICWRDSDQQIVLLDEGTLQTAHYLFVHVSTEPDLNLTSTFTELVPLPHVIVYLRNETDVLIERTMSRQHRRIGHRSPAEKALFVERAVNTFENLIQSSRFRSRLLILDVERDVIIQSDSQRDQSLDLVADILRSGTDRTPPYHSTESISGIDSLAVT